MMMRLIKIRKCIQKEKKKELTLNPNKLPLFVNKNTNIDQIFKISCSLPSRHTEDDVYIINIMEKQDNDSKLKNIFNQCQVEKHKLNDNEFSMQLMNSVVDDKLLSNNIINDIQFENKQQQ